MLALNNECLTRRYLFYCLNLLEGLLGFGLGRLGIFNGRRELRLSSLRVTLHTLVFFHESLELLPHLRHPRLPLLSLGALQSRTSVRSKAALFSALDTASFRVATSVVAPAIPTLFLSFFATKSFL